MLRGEREQGRAVARRKESIIPVLGVGGVFLIREFAAFCRGRCEFRQGRRKKLLPENYARF